jgi:hypothetical protein
MFEVVERRTGAVEEAHQAARSSTRTRTRRDHSGQSSTTADGEGQVSDGDGYGSARRSSSNAQWFNDPRRSRAWIIA